MHWCHVPKSTPRTLSFSTRFEAREGDGTVRSKSALLGTKETTLIKAKQCRQRPGKWIEELAENKRCTVCISSRPHRAAPFWSWVGARHGSKMELGSLSTLGTFSDFRADLVFWAQSDKSHGCQVGSSPAGSCREKGLCPAAEPSAGARPAAAAAAAAGASRLAFFGPCAGGATPRTRPRPAPGTALVSRLHPHGASTKEACFRAGFRA